jgi:hypothetical protein
MTKPKKRPLVVAISPGSTFARELIDHLGRIDRPVRKRHVEAASQLRERRRRSHGRSPTDST